MIVITCRATNTVPSNKLGAYTVEDTAMVYLKRKAGAYQHCTLMKYATLLR